MYAISVTNNTYKYRLNMVREVILVDCSECVNRCCPMYSNNKMWVTLTNLKIYSNSMIICSQF